MEVTERQDLLQTHHIMMRTALQEELDDEQEIHHEREELEELRQDDHFIMLYTHLDKLLRS